MDRVFRLDREEREAVLASLARALSARADVSFATVFGSVLQPYPFRDIDIAVWISGEPDASVDLELAAALTRLAGVPVDVRVVNQAPVTFLYHALRGRPLSVRDENLLTGLIERTARRYHDMAPLVRQATHDAFAA
jgi:predicted nucleotidyltransferase